MARFKEPGVQSIRQYRALRPARTMARILVVIDEFQMLFADNDSPAPAGVGAVHFLPVAADEVVPGR